MTRFTVVVPLYNKRAYIERCIRSIQRQTLSDFRALIIDDGSTDESAEAAKLASAGDPRFEVISVPNGGVSRARNTGSQRAATPWVTFLDADDEWLPDFLTSVDRALNEYPDAELISTGYKVGPAHGLRDTDFGLQAPIVPAFDYYGITVRSIAPICASAVALKRDVLLSFGGFPEDISLGEDIMTWTRFVARGKHVLVNRPLAIYYRDDAGSLTRKPSARQIAGRLRFLDYLDTSVLDGECPPAYRNLVSRIHAEDLMLAGMHGELVRFMAQRYAQLNAREMIIGVLELLRLRQPLQALWRSRAKP